MWWSPLWCRAQLGGGNHSRYEISNQGPSNFHSKNVKHVKNKVNLVNLHMNHMILNTNSGCFGVSETALNIMVCTWSHGDLERLPGFRTPSHGDGYICISTTIIFSVFHGLPWSSMYVFEVFGSQKKLPPGRIVQHQWRNLDSRREPANGRFWFVLGFQLIPILTPFSDTKCRRNSWFSYSDRDRRRGSYLATAVENWRWIMMVMTCDPWHANTV